MALNKDDETGPGESRQVACDAIGCECVHPSQAAAARDGWTHNDEWSMNGCPEHADLIANLSVEDITWRATPTFRLMSTVMESGRELAQYEVRALETISKLGALATLGEPELAAIVWQWINSARTLGMAEVEQAWRDETGLRRGGP